MEVGGLGILVTGPVTTTYPIKISDGTIAADSTGGAFTITLPNTGSVETGRIYTIKVTAGAALVTLAANTGQTIDGSATYTGLTTAHKYVTVQYFQTAGSFTAGTWMIVGNN